MPYCSSCGLHNSSFPCFNCGVRSPVRSLDIGEPRGPENSAVPLGPLFTQAWAKTVPCMRASFRSWCIVLAAALAVGFSVALLGDFRAATYFARALSVATGITLGCGALISLPSSVRLYNPAFGMSAPKLLAVVGFQIATVLIALLGFLFFVVPGFWLMVKFCLAPFVYVLTDGRSEVMTDTWEMTAGRFWLTLMVLLSTAALGQVSALPWQIGSITASVAPEVSLIASMIGLVTAPFVLQFNTIVMVELAAALYQSAAGMTAALDAPASQTA